MFEHQLCPVNKSTSPCDAWTTGKDSGPEKDDITLEELARLSKVCTAWAKWLRISSRSKRHCDGRHIRLIRVVFIFSTHVN